MKLFTQADLDELLRHERSMAWIDGYTAGLTYGSDYMAHAFTNAGVKPDVPVNPHKKAPACEL